MNKNIAYAKIAKRFRGLLPIVVDVETGGLNPRTDALLEVAAVMLKMDDTGKIYPDVTHSCHVVPFPKSKLEPASLEITGIDPFHPFRFAIPEEEALANIFTPIHAAIKEAGCERAVLVGHNANFDLSFLQAAIKRCKTIKSPFHQFMVLDTTTLTALAFGETVLARAAKAAGLDFDRELAHSAIYDAEKTAQLFCLIVNLWKEKSGF